MNIINNNANITRKHASNRVNAQSSFNLGSIWISAADLGSRVYAYNMYTSDSTACAPDIQSANHPVTGRADKDDC